MAVTTSRRRNAGFSLVELMMVISVMAVLAGVLIPYFAPAAIEQLEGAAQLTAADVALTRDLAVTNNSTYQITFDTQHGLYFVQHTGANPGLDSLPAFPFASPADPDDRRTTEFARLPHAGGSVQLAAAAKLLGGGSYQSVTMVEFGPLGETTRAEPTVLFLSVGNGASARFLPIRIDPVTGLAELQPLLDVLPNIVATGGGSS